MSICILKMIKCNFYIYLALACLVLMGKVAAYLPSGVMTRGYEIRTALRPIKTRMLGWSATERSRFAISVQSSSSLTEENQNGLGKPFSGLMMNLRKRKNYYKSDWTDGFNQKSISAILFLFFTCLAPTVAFGGLTNIITNGTIGVIEFILSCGIGGLLYSVFSGQPMTFVGPTGLTLAFMSALYSFTVARGLPFLPLYSWTGLWTSMLLAIISVFNLSDLMGYCTTFTDDVFNALLALNFLFEAVTYLIGNFGRQGVSPASAYTALNIAVCTWLGTRKVVRIGNRSSLISKKFRQFCTDFGPTIIIIAMSVLSTTTFVRAQRIEYLTIPPQFALARGRGWFPALTSVPIHHRLLCILPAILLSMLFYLDQNITVRTTEARLDAKPMRKGVDKRGFYHQDMMTLALITGLLSVFGLPWVCGATVQSLNHVRACSGATWTEKRNVPMEEGKILEEGDNEAPTGGVVKSTTILSDPAESRDGGELSSTQPLILDGKRMAQVVEERKYTDIMETRVTGFSIHAMILSSLLLLPLLSYIPIPVISGIFLYLGLKIMKGNQFFDRLGDIFLEDSKFKALPSYQRINRATLARYLFSQALALAFIWWLKSNKQFSILFPACIAVLAVVRRTVLPKFFSYSELRELDPI